MSTKKLMKKERKEILRRMQDRTTLLDETFYLKKVYDEQSKKYKKLVVDTYDTNTRLFLTGMADSGKQTFMNHLKISYTDFDFEDMKEFYSNRVRRELLQSVNHYFDVMEMHDDRLEEEIKKIRRDSLDERSVEKLLKEAISTIDQTLSPQEITSTFGLSPNDVHFLKHSKRITSRKFKPTSEDVLHLKTERRSVEELFFTYENKPFQIIDTSNQRSNGKQWIEMFRDVSCVVFFLSIDRFDEPYFFEAMHEISELARSPTFKDTPFFIFLNRYDVFEEKIQESVLSDSPDLFLEFDEYLEENKKKLREHTYNQKIISYLKEKIYKCLHDKPKSKRMIKLFPCNALVDGPEMMDKLFVFLERIFVKDMLRGTSI